MSYAIGIDVGGTFTDVVGLDATGRATLVKAASTPVDQSLGVLAGLAALADAYGMALPALLAKTARIVHGTTVATNALLERAGARTAMLTTAGHRDVLAMREGLKPDRYALRQPPPEPLIPRRLRLGVVERRRADGSVEVPLDAASLDAAIATLREQRVEAVAICFLHAWRDDAHERAAAEAVARALPDAFVATSAATLPAVGEFERFSTAAVEAYVGPPVARYLTRLAARLEGAGYAGPLFVILSHGGLAPVAEAARRAAATALSGPAGGVAAAVALSRAGLGSELIAFDMGGTSTDIALVTGGRAATGRGRSVAGQRIALDSLEIETLGAGGGSIAQRSARGTLAVGPESAGAEPGPACYGAGGTRPTVTDANLVLGYLDPDAFLGGKRRLDRDAALRALAALGEELGLDAVTTAAGVRRVVDARMADGVRLATVRRGIDPRGHALLGFGGAAGLHVTAVAAELGMARAAVPLLAAGLSAWGMLGTDLRFDAAASVLDPAGVPEEATLRALYARLETEARARIAGWFAGELTLQRSAEMRLGEQVFAITVPLDDVAWHAPGLPDRLRAAFHAQHRALFTYALEGEEVVLVNARVAAIGALQPAPPAPVPAHAPAEPVGTRVIRLRADTVAAPVYRFAALAPDQRVAGPALVESDTTTVLLRAADTARLDARGWLDIAVG